MSFTIERLRLTLGEVSYALAPVEHADRVKRAVTDALRSGGGFVDVSLDTGCRLSLLVTTTSVVSLLTETVTIANDDRGQCDQQAWGVDEPVVYDGDTPFDVI